MRKNIISLIFIICIMILSSCSIGGSRTDMLNKQNNSLKAEALLEKLIETIESNDKVSLKALFSKESLSKAIDFDDNSNKLLNIFGGKNISWEKSISPIIFESNDYGHRKKEVGMDYYVNIDNQRYLFSLQYYPIDTKNPDNVGIYMFLIVTAEDEEKIYDHTQKILYDGEKKLSPAGIYIPLGL